MTLSLDISNELEQQPKNGAELLAYWQAANLISSRPDITDTEVFSRELREPSQRRVIELGPM